MGEALICLADVCEPCVVQKNLLQYESCNLKKHLYHVLSWPLLIWLFINSCSNMLQDVPRSMQCVLMWCGYVCLQGLRVTTGPECLHSGCTGKFSTVLESSLPDSMMRRHRGIISVVNRKLITSCSSVFTKAPRQGLTQGTNETKQYRCIKFYFYTLQ